MRDHSGRYRVILQTTGLDDLSRWDARSVVVSTTYAAAGEGALIVPQTGGYTFQLIANNPAKVRVDDHLLIESPPAKPQVCSTVGNMAQLVVKTLGLAAGRHSISIERTRGTGPDNFSLLWEGPGLPLSVLRQETGKP